MSDTTPTPPPSGHITPAEARILTALARGSTNAQAAKEFSLSVDTVKGHLLRARRRMGAANTVHLVALAIAARQIPAGVAAGSALAQPVAEADAEEAQQ